jgi:hypothetical protein
VAVVDDVDARGLELADRPRRRLVHDSREARLVKLVAIGLVQRASKVLMLIADLGVRANHGGLHLAASLIFPSLFRDGVGTERVSAGCRGFIGPFPQPLWMKGIASALVRRC